MLPSTVPPMDQLDIATLNDVQAAAPGMSKEEIYEYLTLDPEKFSETEKLYFNQFFNYGRGAAKKLAVERLFQNMKDRNGSAACLAYLKQFGEKWEGEGQAVGSGFNFRVVLDD